MAARCDLQRMPTASVADATGAASRLERQMDTQLRVSLGQCSDVGRKRTNQDFHGACIPREPQLSCKGIAIALADGISSSPVSRIASEAAVKGFLEDYYCTSQAWSVKTSAQRVLTAVNSWLHSQTQHSQYRYEKDLGYVCTLTAMVIKSTTAHLFHVGDARAYRVHQGGMEQLTTDHRLWVSREKSYLSRALGAHAQLDIDYRAIALELGDTFVLATDGVYEFVSSTFIVETLAEQGEDLEAAARSIINEAFANGSEDNLTVQIVRIDALPAHGLQEIQQLTTLPFPPLLEPRALLDGYTVIRELHASSRSHVYLARDEQTGGAVVLKLPSIDLRGDPAYLERFLLEEWIAQRINSAHVLKACAPTRTRTSMYVVMEHIEGQTLRQWMIDRPKPDLETVRRIAEQIAKGLLAFHRLEMLHQDLRPENVMIDGSGTVKIIDFGATYVAGVNEVASAVPRNHLLGTVQYTAPEYFLGEAGSTRSDLFSLAVIVYEMLSGRLPHGTEVAKARTRAAQRKLIYRSVLDDHSALPAWIDGVLEKATHPDPFQRHEELSEFIHDLRHPSPAYLRKTRPPLLERNPVAFWRAAALLSWIVLAWLLLQGR